MRCLLLVLGVRRVDPNRAFPPLVVLCAVDLADRCLERFRSVLHHDRRVRFEVMEPARVLGVAALGRHKCVDALVFDPHERYLANLAGLPPDRGEHDDRDARLHQGVRTGATRCFVLLDLVGYPLPRARFVFCVEVHSRTLALPLHSIGMNRTFVLCKPDAVERGLAGRIVTRFEDKGLKIVAAELRVADSDTLDAHYEEHVEKGFYPDLKAFMSRGPVLAMVLEGPEDTFAMVRSMMGETNPATSPPGTIRGDFGTEMTENLVHGSDSNESAAREIGIWFPNL